jgi:hypothetical protein
MDNTGMAYRKQTWLRQLIRWQTAYKLAVHHTGCKGVASGLTIASFPASDCSAMDGFRKQHKAINTSENPQWLQHTWPCVITQAGQIGRETVVREAVWTVRCTRKGKACKPFINWLQALLASLQEFMVAEN